MRLALILDRHPRDVSKRVRERIAVSHLEWLRSVEAVGGRAFSSHVERVRLRVKAANPSIPDDRLGRFLASMIPGDRGLSRYTEETTEIPASVRQAIDRRIQTAQADIDNLNGAARHAVKREFTQMRERILEKAKVLLTPPTSAGAPVELGPADRQAIRDIVTAEIKGFQDRVILRYGGLLRRSAKAGVILADVPMKLSGVAVVSALPREADPAALEIGRFSNQRPTAAGLPGGEFVEGIEGRFDLPMRQKITDRINRARRGDVGRAVADLEKVIDEPAHWAERIMRTEMGKVAKDASQARLEQHSVTVQKLKKAWVSVLAHNTRPAHRQAHFRYTREPIPVTSFYEVGGERTLQPQGAGLSVGNVVNCLCISSPKVEEAEINVDQLEDFA